MLEKSRESRVAMRRRSVTTDGFRLRWRSKLEHYPAPIRAAGFTLIELSIVLVIIGLIVGGVLVGQDLIKAAQMRNAQSKIESINTAVMAFRLKYDGLPGDLDNSYQFFGSDIGCTDALSTTNSGTGCNGNGNRYININGEMVRAYQQLEAAGLIGEGITMTADLGDVATAGALSPPTGVVPIGPNKEVYLLRCGGDNGFANTICDDTSYLEHSGHAYRVSAWSSANTNIYSYTSYRGAAYAPLDAFNWDQKFDDGLGHTGNIKAEENGTCRNGTTGAYEVATTDKTCYLAIKAPF